MARIVGWLSEAPIGKAVAKFIPSIPFVGPAITRVMNNPAVQQVTQKSQPIINTIESSPAVQTLNSVANPTASVSNMQKTLNFAMNPNSQITGNIYWSLNKLGIPTYIGKTIDFERRYGEHFRNVGRQIEKISGLDNIPVEHIKGVEQALIEKYGLSNLDNIRNSISPNNPSYQKMIDIGNQYLQKAGL